jgi:hypothetical protein
LIIEYLRKYEFIFETVLAHESEDLGVLFAEKNRGSKISRDCPFKIFVPKSYERRYFLPFLVIIGDNYSKFILLSQVVHGYSFIEFEQQDYKMI